MLPSNGYFKNLLCPYFEQNNCSRVFCHFKHKISEPVNYIPTPVHVLQKQQNQQLLKKSKFPDYKPTPIDKLKNHGKTDDFKNIEEKKNSLNNLNDKVNENVFKNIESKLSSIFDNSDDESDSLQVVDEKDKVNKEEKSKNSKLNSKNNSNFNKTKLESQDKEFNSKKNFKQKNKLPSVISQDEQESNPITKKVRVAHKTSEDNRTFNVLLANKNMRMTPAQMMFNRFVTAQENLEKKEEKVSVNEKEINIGKKRIAHTPSLKISSSTNDNNIKNLKRPVLPLELGGKVSTQIRQRYLNLIIDEYLKIDKDEEKVYEKALNEEKNIYKRSPSKNTYLNLSVNAIKRIRDSVKAKEDLKKN